jgi:hypothetical protein
MTTFDRREEAFENRFAHDEELTFKAYARRDLKLGLWAAKLIGLTGEDADAYAQALVSANIQAGGSEAVFAKLEKDFQAAAVVKSTHQIRRQMDQFLAEAKLEVRSD